ncbi:MAG: sugar phosphate isomerase/epimerase family protein [Angelakisella sp.]
MELSTTVNFFILEHNKGMQPYFDELRNYKELGFSKLDCIFCNATEPDSPLRRDDWMQWGEQIAQESRRLGITYPQCHMPYYNFAASPTALDSDLEELIRRSVILAATLGAPWTVSHPATAYGEWNMTEASKKVNLAYFSRYVALGEQYHIGIAIENMADFPGQGYKRSYCATVEELCDLVDSLNSPYAGICWDFGHANLVYQEQAPCLRAIGKRLKALHVHDNKGDTDSHLPPFFGNIAWEQLLPVLPEIGYRGEFSFEIKRIPWRLPKELRNAQWIYAKTAGTYLLSLIS